MADVSYIHDGSVLVGENGVNEDCIGLLERLLERAKAGEVIGVCAAVQYADGATTSLRGGFLFDQRIIGALMVHVVRISSE